MAPNKTTDPIKKVFTADTQCSESICCLLSRIEEYLAITDSVSIHSKQQETNLEYIFSDCCNIDNMFKILENAALVYNEIVTST